LDALSYLRAAVVGASLVASAVLVLVLRYDLRIDRGMSHETYWRSPTLYKGWVILRLAIKYLIFAAILALVAVLVLGNVPQLGLPRLQLRAVAEARSFWIIIAANLFLLALRDGLRCRRASLWDLFISYKSEDVTVVRAVVDQLIGSGLRVWFAEYQILLQNYDRFQEALDTGLRNCASAVVFTNNRYANSEYCQHELRVLLDRLPPESILEIMIPREELPHTHSPLLAYSPSYEGGHVDGILAFIASATGLPVQSAPVAAPDSVPSDHGRLACLGKPFGLNTAGWEVTQLGKLDGSGSTAGLAMRRRDAEGHGATVNLYCGGGLDRPVQRTEGGDDRQVYRGLRSVAGQYLRLFPSFRLRGLHLFYQAGFSHMALTIFTGLFWTRKYSIILPSYAQDESVEFVFDFGFLGGFLAFCRAVPLMDELVKSLRW
jgi:hypothetical protein